MKYLKIINRFFMWTLLLCSSMYATAQTTAAAEPEMAEAMRSNGKIYVVVGVITIIFLVIVVYLVTLNRKLNKLEKLIGDKK